MIGQGFEDRYLTDDETRAIVRDGLASLALDGKRVLFIVPDGTRTMPMPRMFALFRELLAGRARAVDFLIALGTHQPLPVHALPVDALQEGLELLAKGLTGASGLLTVSGQLFQVGTAAFVDRIGRPVKPLLESRAHP